jgi:hypothetical protein
MGPRQVTSHRLTQVEVWWQCAGLLTSMQWEVSEAGRETVVDVEGGDGKGS